jgi:type IV pilus assembly protein PilO
MALSSRERQQLLALAIILALGAAAAFWFYWRQPKLEEVQTLQRQVDSLRAMVDSARQDLARGTVEDLRRRVADYEGGLSLMRQLVPSGAEVPSLIDDVASRARLRGVEIGQINPQPVTPDIPFQVQRYRFNVFGHFDQIGEFLADIASLQRIMVPYNVAINPASSTAQQAYADTSGALLEAQFQLRTFVKPQAPGDSIAGL